MKYIVALVLALVLAWSWVSNLITLTECDFVAPYKCEVVHSIGIIPIIAVVTAHVEGDQK